MPSPRAELGGPRGSHIVHVSLQEVMTHLAMKRPLNWLRKEMQLSSRGQPSDCSLHRKLANEVG